jgi:putative transposase
LLAELEARLPAEEYEQLLDELQRKVVLCEEVIALRNDPQRTEKVAALRERHGVPDRTLRRWVHNYEQEGVAGLLHRRYRLMTERRVHPELIRFIKKEYLQPHRPTAQYVYERTVARAAELGLPAPSRATVYRIINEDILPGERVLAHEGLKAFRQKVEPKCRRNFADLAKNEIWTGDGHVVPVFLNFNGRAAKAVVSVWIDMRTRVVTGFCVSRYDSSTTIGLALRHGILPKPNSPVQGTPCEIYTDNGKDYRSRHLAVVYASLRIDERFCEPYSPWAKPIERFFETMHLRFSKYLPGYCGNDPNERPEGFDEKKLLRQGKLLTPEQFAALFEEWIANDYHRRRHAELGAAPLEVYESLPAARPEMPDPRALDVLLMKQDEVKIYQDGIRKFGRLFWADELMPFVQETVTIRWDPNRVGEIVVFRRGMFLCVAKNRELLSMRATESQLKEHAARQRRARKFFRQRLAELDAPLCEVPDMPRVPGQSVPGGRAKVRMITGFEKAARALDEPDDGPLPDTERRDRAKEFLLRRADKFLTRVKEG